MDIVSLAPIVPGTIQNENIQNIQNEINYYLNVKRSIFIIFIIVIQICFYIVSHVFGRKCAACINMAQ